MSSADDSDSARTFKPERSARILRRGEFATTDEILEYFGTSRKTLETWIARGIVPMRGMGRDTFFSVDNVFDTMFEFARKEQSE